jgi:hypothetical protein
MSGCDDIAFALGPGAEAKGRVFILERDGGRTYRISMNIGIDGQPERRVIVATEPFYVIRRNAPA